MTVLAALLNSLAFPISASQAEVIATCRDLDLGVDFTSGIAQSRQFELAQADCIRNAIFSPNVSEGGVSISWGDRRAMMAMMNRIYAKYGEPLIKEENPTVEFLKDWM
jgi:hypothetical protein